MFHGVIQKNIGTVVFLRRGVVVVVVVGYFLKVVSYLKGNFEKPRSVSAAEEKKRIF